MDSFNYLRTMADREVNLIETEAEQGLITPEQARHEIAAIEREYADRFEYFEHEFNDYI